MIAQETKEKIVSLWQEGKSGDQIAEEIGSTRNAVIGFINRERKRGVELRGAIKVVRPMRIKPPKKIISIFERRLPASKRENLRLHELAPTSCRFIVAGEGLHAVFCGKPKEYQSYCKHHASLCYVPPKKR
jgi:hypothetical protein